MRKFLIAGAAAIAVAVSGCGGDDKQQQASTPATTAKPTPTTPTTTSPAKKPKTTATTPTDTGASTTPDNSGREAKGTPAVKPKTTGGKPGKYAPASPAVRDAVDASVTGFYNALADGDGAKACSLLLNKITAQLTKSLSSSPQLKGKGCPGVFELISKNYPDQLRQRLHGLKIQRVSVHGNKAVAAYTGVGVSKSQITVIREDGRWKLAAFKGVPPSLKG